MSYRIAFLLVLISLGFEGSAVRAEKGSDIKPTLAKPGKVLFETTPSEAGSSPELDKPWTVAKGIWKMQEGVIVGREKKEDKHAAVLALQQPNRNSLVRFSFKLDGATGFNLSLNDAKGHLFRISVAESGLTLTKDANKKDPNSKPTILAKGDGKFESGKWHTLLVEIQGDKVAVQSDNGVHLEGQESSLDVEKTGYRFVIRGETISLADIKIWAIEL